MINLPSIVFQTVFCNIRCDFFYKIAVRVSLISPFINSRDSVFIRAYYILCRIKHKESSIFWHLKAAGAFIYIALVDMLPELRVHNAENSWRRFGVHQGKTDIVWETGTNFTLALILIWILSVSWKQPVDTNCTYIITECRYQAKSNYLINSEQKGLVLTKQLHTYSVMCRESFFQEIFNLIHWPQLYVIGCWLVDFCEKLKQLQKPPMYKSGCFLAWESRI